MAQAMAVVPAEPSPTDTAVGNLRESLTTLLQVLGGDPSTSDASLLSDCKSDLEYLLDPTSCKPTAIKVEEAPQEPMDKVEKAPEAHWESGGQGFPVITLKSNGSAIEESWQVEAVPKTWSVSRKTILSTRVGDFLELRSLTGKIALAALIIVIVLFFALKQVAVTKLVASYTNKQGITIVAMFSRPNEAIYLGFLLFLMIALFLMYHRMNKAIFFRSLFCFDGIACAGSQIGFGMLALFNSYQTLGSQFDTTWMLLLTVQMLLFCCFVSPLVACLDALRFGRRTVMAGQCVVLLVYGFLMVSARCADKEYPEQLMVCAPNLMKFREMAVHLIAQATIFMVKNLAGKFGGSYFGGIHPSYVPSSQNPKATSQDAVVSSKVNSSCPTALVDGAKTAAVGNLRELVTALLQILGDNPSTSVVSCRFELSQESISMLSTCKSDLERLLAPTASGQAEENPMVMARVKSGGEGFPVMKLKCLGKTADDTWHLEASPQTMSVSRKTMFSSRLVDFLEKRHLLERAILTCVLMGVLLAFAHKKVCTTEINVIYTNQQGVTTAAQFQRPHPGLYLAFLVPYAFGMWLLWHRINKRIAFLSVFCFDGLIVIGCMSGYQLINKWNFHQTLGSQFDTTWMVLQTVQTCIFCGGMAPTVACFDAMRINRRSIIAGQVGIVMLFGMYVLQGRCSSLEYPEDLMVCTPRLMTFREISAALMLQSCVFIAKNVFGKFGGSARPFGAIHPIFVPSSQAHKETNLVKKMLKRISSRRASETKKISSVDPTSIAQVGTGAERKEGDDSALESGDHEDLNFDDLTTV